MNAKLREIEKEKLKKYCEIELSKRNKEIDLFDFNAELDSSLTYHENKSILLDKIDSLFGRLQTQTEIKNKIAVREYEKLQELQIQEKKAIEKFNSEVNALKDSEQTIIDKYLLPIEYIKSIARGHNKAFIFLGGCGIGKSFITRQTLAKEGVKFIENRGVNSPLGLYQFLYENNQKDTIIVFDDISGLLENQNAYSILLGILWEGLASWNSTTTKLKIPKQFLFNGKLIIIANKLKGELREFFEISEADIVKSRCLTYKLELAYEDIIKMMFLIAKQPHPQLTPPERQEIVNFIKENTGKTTQGLDLRTQVKAENLYLYDKQKWKWLVKPLLTTNNTLECLEYCLKNSNSIKEAEKLFCEETGYSRNSFYKIKKRYLK